MTDINIVLSLLVAGCAMFTAFIVYIVMGHE
jgi:hypothetical protein